MPTLDTFPLLKRDPGKVGAALDLFSEQLHDGWHQAKPVTLPADFRKITKVAVCGMGGSHLGADILRSVWADRIPVPVAIIADYTLPAWVDRQTLVIASSYSGSTEETLTCLKAALRRKARVVVITSGGQLAKAAASDQLPSWQFVPSANPSGQPRLGVGYNLMALVALAWKMQWIKNPDREVETWIKRARSATAQYHFSRSRHDNLAKQLAQKFAKKWPLLIGAEWTAGNLHTWHNQINENAKTPASWFLIPDLNHHLLEGLRNRRLTRQMHALLVLDATYHPRNQRRLLLTAKILKNNGLSVSTFRPHGQNTMEKAIDLLTFGGYVSWYLSALRGLNPAPIPTVDYLKQALGKR